MILLVHVKCDDWNVRTCVIGPKLALVFGGRKVFFSKLQGAEVASYKDTMNTISKLQGHLKPTMTCYAIMQVANNHELNIYAPKWVACSTSL